MKHNIIYLIFIFLFSVSCHKQTPKGIIEESKMINLLKELHLVQAKFQSKAHKSKNISLQLSKEEFTKVFLKYNITLDTFKKSYQYYENDLENFSKIYTKVKKLLKEDIKLIKEDIKLIKQKS